MRSLGWMNVLGFGLGMLACSAPQRAHAPPHTAPAAPPPPATAEATPVLTIDPNGAAPTILVMPLHADASLTRAASALDELILNAVGSERRYQVLGAEDINSLVGAEKLKDALGCDSESCMSEVGNALGASYLVAGKLSPLGDEAVLSLRLMDTRHAKILARGSARGPTTANGLSKMMATAVSSLMGMRVAEVTEVHDAAPTPPGQYPAYDKMVADLSAQMARAQYVAVLQSILTYTRTDVAMPPGQDKAEVLTYYRASACYMQQRAQCLETVLQHYAQAFPNGPHRETMDAYRSQIETVRAGHQKRMADLEAQLSDIQSRRMAGRVSDEQALEMSANAAMVAATYKRALDFLQPLMAHAAHNDDRWFALAAQSVTAHTLLGDFDQARKMLQDAQMRNPRMFQLRGMNAALARLPP